MPEAPQAFIVVDRKGHIVSTNIEAVLEWRKKHEPEVYKAAIDRLAQIIAEAAVDQLDARGERGIQGVEPPSPPSPPASKPSL